jgi:hypothetical protein
MICMRCAPISRIGETIRRSRAGENPGLYNWKISAADRMTIKVFETVAIKASSVSLAVIENEAVF